MPLESCREEATVGIAYSPEGTYGYHSSGTHRAAGEDQGALRSLSLYVLSIHGQM